MPEKATLSVLSVESVTSGGPAGGVAVCVVRCTEGTARLGMVFRHLPHGNQALTAAPLTLRAIEWYGKRVDQLDTVHSGKVTLAGDGAEALAAWDVLDSAPRAGATP